MPRVPTQVGPSVAPSGGGVVFQNPQGASIDAFGGGTGQALQQVARAGGTLDQLDTLVLREIAEDNEREAKNLDIAFQSRLRVLMHGDGTANNPGFLGLQGENALKARESFQQEVEKARRDVFGRASPRVRQIVEPVAAARLNDVFERSSNHLRQQREVAFDQTTKARIAEAYQEASINWNDPAKLMESVGVITDEMIAEGERLGRPDEVTETLIQGHRSKVFQSAIEAAIPVDPMTAQTMLVKYAPLMDGDVQSEVAAKLRPFVVQQVAQDAAQEAIAKFGFQNRAAAEQWIREKFSGDQEKEAVDTLNQIFSGYRSDKAEARAASSHAMSVTRFKQDQEEFKEDQAVDQAMVAIAAMTREEADKAIKEAPPGLREKLTIRADNFFTNKEQNETALAVREGERQGLAAAQKGESIVPLVANTNNPAQVKAAISTYNVAANANEKQIKEQQEAFYKEAGQAIGGLQSGQGGMTLNEFMKANPDRWTAMSADPERLESLKKTWAAAEEGRFYAFSSDGETLPKLRGLSIKALAETDLVQLQGSLTEAEFKAAQNLQKGARSKMESMGDEQAIYGTGDSVLRDFADVDAKRNWEQGDETPKQAQQRQAFQHEMNKRIAEQLEQGNKPSREDLNRWAAEIVTPIYADPSDWPFDDIKTFAVYKNKLTPEQRKVVRVPIDTMPPTMRVEIEALLLKKGKRADDESVIENLAGARLMRDTARATDILNSAENAQGAQ